MIEYVGRRAPPMPCNARWLSGCRSCEAKVRAPTALSLKQQQPAADYTRAPFVHGLPARRAAAIRALRYGGKTRRSPASLLFARSGRRRRHPMLGHGPAVSFPGCRCRSPIEGRIGRAPARLSAAAERVGRPGRFVGCRGEWPIPREIGDPSVCWDGRFRRPCCRSSRRIPCDEHFGITSASF